MFLFPLLFYIGLFSFQKSLVGEGCSPSAPYPLPGLSSHFLPQEWALQGFFLACSSWLYRSKKWWKVVSLVRSDRRSLIPLYSLWALRDILLGVSLSQFSLLKIYLYSGWFSVILFLMLTTWGTKFLLEISSPLQVALIDIKSHFLYLFTFGLWGTIPRLGDQAQCTHWPMPLQGE